MFTNDQNLSRILRVPHRALQPATPYSDKVFPLRVFGTTVPRLPSISNAFCSVSMVAILNGTRNGGQGV